MKRPDNTYLLLDVRFKPAHGAAGEELFAAYFVVAREITAASTGAAFALAKSFHKHPIIEEKTSFWSRIEAAKALGAARLARNIYQGAPHGNHLSR